MNFPYEDIVNLPHFKASGKKAMSNSQRAAQFMPFKSLNEYEKLILDKTEKIDSAPDENYEIEYF